MKSLVLNAEKLHLNDANFELLNERAQLHQRFSAIEFKVLDFDRKKAVIRVVQDKSFHGNYFDTKRLVEIVQETFSDLLPGVTLLSRPYPYKPSPTDVVDANWVKKKLRPAARK